MTNHNHSFCCEHANMAYCKHCRVPYCKDCGYEWKPYNWNYIYSYPYYTTGGNTTYQGNTPVVGDTVQLTTTGTCSGNHEG